MSDSGKAVFLSYASQDAEAAKRICDALRQAGVEVWFDAEGGLEHGDEWDAKIRRQIKDCLLFLPIISANTQAREEGYFRIEWDLAAERARGIASGVAFILPVVIDATKQADALVPDRFRSVQWTRLPGGAVPPEVLQHFLKLWSHRTGVLKHVREAGSGGTVGGGPWTENSRRSRPAWLVPVSLAVAVLAAAASWFALKSGPALPPPASGLKPALSPANGPSEAKQLVAQAWAQMNRLDLGRAELQVADELCRRASVLDPTDPDVWAAWSFVDAWYCYHAFDNSSARREGARSKAARALNLAPLSYEARLAQANYLVREGSDAAVSLYAPEADRLLRALLQERPTEPRALLTFAMLQRNLGQGAEARQALQALTKDPAFAALAWHELAWVELRAGNPAAALKLEDRSIALQAAWHNLTGKMNLLMGWAGDLVAAKVVLDQIPAVAMQEDYTVSVALRLLYTRRTPDALLRLADSVPRDWLQSNMYLGPLGWWKGLAEQQAGHPTAARIHWQAAQKLVERRLADAPSSPELIAWKSRLLAVLGEAAEAEKTLQLARELGGVNYAAERWGDEIRVGQSKQALDEMESEYQAKPGGMWAAYLRYSPEFDPLREQPRFIALLEKMEADPRCSPKAKPAVPELVERAHSRPPESDAKSVAVLAFADLSEKHDNEYFSDGISEELLNVLAKIPGLKVTARTSSFHFKGTNTAIPEIAKQLGVAYVVEGSVRKAGDKVRITAQLIKAADGFHVWSDTFTRDLKDIFAVQDEIAGLIAQQMQLKLGTATRVAREINPEAYRLVLEGRYFWNQRSSAALDHAESAYTRALVIDPDFAEAHAALADLWVIRGWYLGMGGGPESLVTGYFAKARTEVDRAITLDPELADSYAALGAVLFSAFKFDESLRQLARAVALNPNRGTTRHWHSIVLAGCGRIEEAYKESEVSISLDPLLPTALWNAAAIRYHDGHWNETLALCDRALVLRPGFLPVLGYQALALWGLGRKEEAVKVARMIAADHDAEIRWEADYGAIYVLAQWGLKREADDLVERISAPLPPDSYRRAFALVAVGRGDEALNRLKTFPAMIMNNFASSPMWNPWREDPRFKQLMADNHYLADYERTRAEIVRLRKEQEKYR